MESNIYKDSQMTKNSWMEIKEKFCTKNSEKCGVFNWGRFVNKYCISFIFWSVDTGGNKPCAVKNPAAGMASQFAKTNIEQLRDHALTIWLWI